MKIDIHRTNKAVHLQAVNEHGNTVEIDGSPEIGGENGGFRPMQLILAGLGSCSTMDIISILTKQKEPLDDISIEVNGQRADAIPAVFTDIHVKFILKGNLNPHKVKRAVDLSATKYCSVVKMLENSVNITHSYEII